MPEHHRIVIAGLLEEARRSLRLSRQCRTSGYEELGDVLERSTVKIYQFIEELQIDHPDANFVVEDPVRNIH